MKNNIRNYIIYIQLKGFTCCKFPGFIVSSKKILNFFVRKLRSRYGIKFSRIESKSKYCKKYNNNNKIFRITRQCLSNCAMFSKIERKLIQILQKINLKNKKV